jgi:hypothetical protein
MEQEGEEMEQEELEEWDGGSGGYVPRTSQVCPGYAV